MPNQLPRAFFFLFLFSVFFLAADYFEGASPFHFFWFWLPFCNSSLSLSSSSFSSSAIWLPPLLVHYLPVGPFIITFSLAHSLLARFYFKYFFSVFRSVWVHRHRHCHRVRGIKCEMFILASSSGSFSFFFPFALGFDFHSAPRNRPLGNGINHLLCEPEREGCCCCCCYFQFNCHRWRGGGKRASMEAFSAAFPYWLRFFFFLFFSFGELTGVVQEQQKKCSNLKGRCPLYLSIFRLMVVLFFWVAPFGNCDRLSGRRRRRRWWWWCV